MIHWTRAGLAVCLAALLAPPVMAQRTRRAAAPTGPAAAVEAMADAVIDRLVIASDMHWHKGEYNHIVNLSRMVIAGRPDDVDTYGSAGWLLWSMDRDAEAVALYEQGLRANPRSASMADELGYYYYNRKKDYPRAVQYYERASQLKDCPPATLHMLAHAYEKVGRLNRAYAIWQRAATMSRNPSRAAAVKNMERVRRLLEAQDRPRSG